MLDQGEARVGEPNAAAEAGQHRRAELLLEPRDVMRDRGLGVAERPRRAGSDPSRATALEHLQAADVEHRPKVSMPVRVSSGSIGAFVAPFRDGARRGPEAFLAGGACLNTATYGLPPRIAVEALQTALDEWRHGRTQFQHWDESVGRAPPGFAALAGVDPGDVAVGGRSPLRRARRGGAAGRRAGARRGGRLHERAVPLPRAGAAGRGGGAGAARAAGRALGPRHDLVAFSAVLSADGRIADVDAIVAAAAAHDVRTFTDTTQGTGWHDLDHGRFDYTACAGYKWLLGPRGTAYYTLRPEQRDGLIPHGAGGTRARTSTVLLRRAAAAGRERTSLRPLAGLALLGGRGAGRRAPGGARARAVGAHDVAMANRLREGLGCRRATRRSSPSAASPPTRRSACRRRGDGGRARRRAAPLLPPLHDGGGRRPRAAVSAQPVDDVGPVRLVVRVFS